MNMAQVLGRVGKIDTKTTTKGLKICNLSMVTSKKFVKDGEKVEKVTWHNISFFSKLAEIAEKYVAVGDMLYIQGEMEVQKYTSADGQAKTKHYILGHNLELMPKGKEHQAVAKDNAFAASAGVEDDGVPW